MWEEETLVLNIKWGMEFNTDKCEIMLWEEETLVLNVK